jgi:hypothetical protein
VPLSFTFYCASSQAMSRYTINGILKNDHLNSHSIEEEESGESLSVSHPIFHCFSSNNHQNNQSHHHANNHSHNQSTGSTSSSPGPGSLPVAAHSIVHGSSDPSPAIISSQLNYPEHQQHQTSTETGIKHRKTIN